MGIVLYIQLLLAKSWFSQLPDNPCFNKDVLLEKLKKETYDNAYQVTSMLTILTVMA